MSAVTPLSQSPLLVGAAFISTSVLLSTYSTTKFLSYNPSKLPKLPPSISTPNVPSRKKLPSARVALSRPLLLALYRFSCSLVISIMTLSLRNNPLPTLLRTLPTFLLPALSLFLANLFNSYSLSEMGIANTYTTKCLIPIFTLLSSLLLKTPLPPTRSLAALLPISLGVALSSATNTAFTSLGFTYALLSCIGQVSLNMSSKAAMRAANLDGQQCQLNLVAVGMLLVGATQAVTTIVQCKAAPVDRKASGVPVSCLPPPPPATLALFAGLSYHFEYTFSFIYISLVSPLTFAVTDAVRRVGIILAGQAYFGETDMKRMNVVGIGMALAGVTVYSLAQ